MIKNRLITAYDIINDHTMFDPNIAGTGGNTEYQNPNRVVVDYIVVPKELFKLLKLITLMSDVIFFNRPTFLIAM